VARVRSTEEETTMRNERTELDESERTRCEVWTRVMGYHRPVSAFNPGKQSEHRERIPFNERRAALGA
jgi:anaerobic ribonucleoside-triphosphate reductase